MKLYTKIGDKGRTLLVTGEKIPKDSLRIEAYGTIDELNAFTGSLRDQMASSNLNNKEYKQLLTALETIQNEMHDLGSELATPTAKLKDFNFKLVSSDSIARLESEIDSMTEQLPELKNFVLPGGHSTNSAAHICRTICRRAERRVLALASAEELREEPRIYLNRLSDWFFACARMLSHLHGARETIWGAVK